MVLNYYIETDPPSEKESTSPMTRPMLRQLNADVEEAGGDHVIFDMIAEGTPLGKIAQRFNVSRPMLYKWRDHSPRKESRRRYWTEAMKLRAEAHEEKAGEVLGDKPPITSADARWRSDKSNYHKWQAAVYDRDKYGDKPADVNVTVNAGSLHLDALRKHGRMQVEERIQEAEVEILPLSHPAQDEFDADRRTLPGPVPADAEADGDDP